MSIPNVTQVIKQLESIADHEIAQHSARYFKTGPGEYGEGDRFRGIRVPALRKLVRKYRALPHADVLTMLHSAWHEDRLLALLIWVEQYRRGDVEQQRRIFDDYLANTTHINNWDLVDSSTPKIIGAHLYAQVYAPGHAAGAEGAPIALLTTLAHSSELWERRIAIMATMYFIDKGEYAETLRLADLLLHDEQDLIHKAVGWMLREVGKQDPATEEAFLLPRYQTMPRTMLRYAIEKFPEARRKAYLHGTL